jgi:hypothetical protein
MTVGGQVSGAGCGENRQEVPPWQMFRSLFLCESAIPEFPPNRQRVWRISQEKR